MRAYGQQENVRGQAQLVFGGCATGHVYLSQLIRTTVLNLLPRYLLPAPPLSRARASAFRAEEAKREGRPLGLQDTGICSGRAQLFLEWTLRISPQAFPQRCGGGKSGVTPFAQGAAGEKDHQEHREGRAGPSVSVNPRRRALPVPQGTLP